MKNLFIPVLCFLSIYNLQAQNVQQLRLDPASALGGNFSDIFSTVNFIPLETNNTSIFSAVDQLEVTKKYFIILDRETNAILIFTKNGKFHTKITGASIGYRNSMQYFYYDPLTELIKIPSRVKRNEMIAVNLEGKVVKRSATLFNTFDEIFFFPDSSIGHISYNVDPRLNSTLAYEVFVEKTDQVLYRYFPYNTKTATIRSNDIIWNSHMNFYQSDSDTTTLLVRPYDFHIYRLSPKSLDTAYEIVLPMANSLPASFRTDSTINGKRSTYLLQNPELVYNISHTYKLNDKLFFKLNSMGKSNYSFVYNMKDESLIDLLKVTPDQGSSYLAITDFALGGAEFLNKNFLNTDGESLYTSYSASRFLNQRDENKSKIVNYPPELQNIFDGISSKSNPLIIQIKPKRD